MLQRTISILISPVLVLAAVCVDAADVVHWDDAEPLRVTPVRDREGRAVFLRELYSLRRHEDYRIAQALGFNAVIGNGPGTIEQAGRVGFYVTEASWYHRGFDPEAAAGEAEAFRDCPRLIAYNLNDEPDVRTHIAPPAVLDSAAAVLHRHDPRAQTSVTLAGWEGFAHHLPDFARVVDIVRVDPYPLIEGEPLDQVRALVERARDVAPGKPVLSILQAWKWSGARFPSRAQLRQMAWQSLIAGCSGLSYYDWNDAVWCEHPGIMAAMSEVNSWIAGDLEPFLVHGERYPAVARNDAYAALWRLPAGKWRLLIVRLGNRPGTTRARFRLPAELRAGGPMYAYEVGTSDRAGDGGAGGPAHPHSFRGPDPIIPADDGKFTVQLPELAAMVVAPEAIALPGPALMLAPFGASRDQAANSVPYKAGLAGRPMEPIEQPRSLEPCVLLPPAAPWRAAGISLRVSPADPFLRLPIFPGGRFTQRLRVHAGHTVPPAVQLCSWHDNRGLRTGAGLDSIVTLRTAAATADTSVHLLDVHLPPGEWDTSRDHLLRLRVGASASGPDSAFHRVLRYRVQRPFVAEWTWIDNTRGHVLLEPRFPEASFPQLFGSTRIAVLVGGRQAPCDSTGRLRRRTRELPVPEQDTTVPLPVRVQASSGTVPVLDLEVTNLHVMDGQPLSPAYPRPAVIHAVRESFELQSAPWRRLWRIRRSLSPLTHFLVGGQRRFARENHRAWLVTDGRVLVWFMDCEAPGGVRAQTAPGDHDPGAADRGAAFARHKRDVAFGGDDVAKLAIGPADGAVYMIQVNANGAARYAQIVPEARSWTPRVVVRARRQEKRWQVIVGVPLRDLGVEPGEGVRLNIGAVRSVAPTLFTSWRYWSSPLSPEATLVTAALPEL